MITNDNELRITRERLGLVEAALESLRRDVMPKNERLYHLMAGSYIDLIQSIRGDIDTYLGIVTAPENAALAISLEGEAVSLGRTSAGLITRTTEVEGVIRSVDLDAQTFVLRERSNNLPDLPCEYSTQIEEAVKEFLDCRVTVSGTLETSRMTRREKMEAETIEVASAEEESAGATPADGADSPSR